MVVVDAGHIDDAHTAPANVAHDLVLLVEAVLAGRGGQLVSEHVPGALTPPQADHGLAPLPLPPAAAQPVHDRDVRQPIIVHGAHPGRASGRGHA